MQYWDTSCDLRLALNSLECIQFRMMGIIRYYQYQMINAQLKVRMVQHMSCREVDTNEEQQ